MTFTHSLARYAASQYNGLISRRSRIATPVLSTRIIYALLPAPVRIQGLPIYFKNFCLDIFELLAGRRNPAVPPRRLNISGSGSFWAIGNHNVTLCHKFGRLQPTHSVLDLGCGIGRTALAMSNFLRPPGSYTGIDVIDFAVRWCQTNITAKYPNFTFMHADVRNRMYNPRGRTNPHHFSFPFPQEKFDFCTATSLFTHLLPEATERYVAEVSRVLRKDGCFLSTWFLLDEETEPFVNAGLSEYTFPFRFISHAQRRQDIPEQVVAYYGHYLKALFARVGLEIEAVYYGGWSGHTNRIDSGQDIIVARRAARRLIRGF